MQENSGILSNTIRFGLIRRLLFVVMISTSILILFFALIDWHIRLYKLRTENDVNFRASAQNLLKAISIPVKEKRIDIIRDVVTTHMIMENYAGVRIEISGESPISLWAGEVERSPNQDPTPKYIEKHLLMSPVYTSSDPTSPQKQLCSLTLFHSKDIEFIVLMKQVRQDVIKAFVLALCIAVILGFLFTKYLINPIESIQRSVESSVASLRRGEIDNPPSIEAPIDQAFGGPFRFKEIVNINQSVKELGKVMREKQNSLQKSQENLVAVLSAIGDGVIVVNLRGYVNHINPAACRLIGLSNGESIGKHYTQILHITDRNTGAEIQSTLSSVLSTGNRAAHIHPVELHAQNDLSFFVDSLSTPLFNSEEKLVGAVLVLHECTEKILLQSQMKNVQRMELVGSIASGLAHDLNNMVCGIAGATDLLLSTGLNEQQTHHVNLVQRSLLGIATMMKQLLLFSRQDPPEKEIVNLHHILRDSVALVQPGASLISFTMKFSAAVIQIYANPAQIQSLFMNLFLNAKDSMTQGGDLLIRTDLIDVKNSRITRSGLPIHIGSFVKVTVNDTGCGISDEILDKVFEPFFTTKTKGKGTGLGLASVFTIVKDLEGGIDVRSIPGQGTRFEIYLPVTKIETRQSGNVSVIPANKNAQETIPLPTIQMQTHTLPESDIVWVNDQDQIVSKLTTAILSEHGFHVIEESSMSKITERILESGARLLITDLNIMHKLSENKMAQLREDCGFFPILISTSVDLDDLRVSYAMRYPQVFYIQKPFTAQSLTQKVEEIFQNTKSNITRNKE